MKTAHGSLKHRVFSLQGLYYFATGIWPLLHMQSFEAVTGPKTDDWIVYTVGFLLITIGVTLYAGAAKNINELFILSIGTAASLASMDLYFSLHDVIARIYLLDAAVEIIIILAALVSGLGGKKGRL